MSKSQKLNKYLLVKIYDNKITYISENCKSFLKKYDNLNFSYAIEH